MLRLLDNRDVLAHTLSPAMLSGLLIAQANKKIAGNIGKNDTDMLR